MLKVVWLWVLLISALTGVAQAAEKPLVLSSIMPLHLIVSEIGGEAVRSELLIPAILSPHDYQLKPSDVQRLRNADAVVWVGPGLEPSLRKLLRKLDTATALYPDMAPGEDPHMWLDGEQVQQIAHRIARVLSGLLPVRGAYFHANAARFAAEFRQYDKQLAARLDAREPRNYLWLHDGFSRFEQHYQLPRAAAVMQSDEHVPGARRIVALRKQLQAGEFDCVFREPQYSTSMLNALVADLDIPVIEIDPLGVGRERADGFLDLYRQLGKAFLSCFGP